MIIDITGIELIPGSKGINCKGNGRHRDNQGNMIECCCDECDYMMCCISENPPCKDCNDSHCPAKLPSGD